MSQAYQSQIEMAKSKVSKQTSKQNNSLALKMTNHKYDQRKKCPAIKMTKN